MDELDLCIANYSFDDILNVFNLKYDFDENDLRRAKKQALMSHPDKSKLDKSYYIFFTSAYKLLNKIHEYRKNRDAVNLVTSYDPSAIDSELNNAELLNNPDVPEEFWKNLVNHKDFHSIFNMLYEKNAIDNPSDAGHGDWLGEEEEEIKATSIEDMHRLINERKSRLRALVTVKEINGLSNYSGSSIVGDIEGFRSGGGTSLQYDDVKHAYTDSVIPVTEEDYTNNPGVTTEEALIRKRASLIPTLSAESYASHLRDKQAQEDADNAERLYKLVSQDEANKKARSNWVSSLLKIGY